MLRRTPIKTKINHERWLVSYADFVTLLFAFFVVMYSVSQVSETKYRQLSDTLDAAFSSPQTRRTPADPSANTPPDSAVNLAPLDEITAALEAALAPLGVEGKIHITGNEQWVEIELSANLLFSSASAQLQAEAETVLNSVAEILAPYDNAIAIAGHTDDLPIATSEFKNNWLLSSARAVAVVNLLAYQGVKPERLSAVGYGEYQPIVANDTEDGRARNRRVVLKVARTAVAASKLAIEDYQQEQGEQGGDATAPDTPSVAPNTDRTNAAAADAGSNSAVTNPPVTNPPATNPTATAAPSPTPEVPVEPLRLRNGGLLFTSDPDLPRNNPPVANPQ